MIPTRMQRTAAAVLLAASVTTGCLDASTPPGSSDTPRPSAQSRATTPPRDGDRAPGTGPRYVAMGDSAAAAPLVPEQAPPPGCFKSTNDYPSVLARRIGAAAFSDATCSGAKTENLVSRAQSTRLGPVSPQLDAVAHDTELVTITIGGNDVDLFTDAMKCRRTTLDEPPCSPQFVVDGVDGISRAIDEKTGEWSKLVATVRAKAPGARVILVGYGTYVRPEGCFPAQPIDPVDAAYFQGKLDELDDRLSRVAGEQGVEFFDTRALSVGHDICAAPQDRYVEGFVTERPAAPLHPNAKGAAAFGNAVADYVAG